MYRRHWEHTFCPGLQVNKQQVLTVLPVGYWDETFSMKEMFGWRCRDE